MSITSFDAIRPAATLRLPLWLWPALATLALLLALGGRLLNDPDTYWQIAVGDWIIAHDALPITDLFSLTMKDQPWISTSWVAQVMFALVHRAFGWAGPVALTALAAAAAIGLLARFVGQRLAAMPTLILSIAALILIMPHLVARPHALAMPLLVLWCSGLIAAADRREAPTFWLLPLITIWANLHGSFMLGLAMTGAIACDAVWNAAAPARTRLALRWAAFGVLAVIACCVTPYGAGSLLAAWRILTLGDALPMIVEWRPTDFAKFGPFEIVVLGAFALALWRGVTLPPLRIAILLGLVHMALSSARHADALALIAPLLLAAPLAPQAGSAEPSRPASAAATILQLAGALLLVAASVTMLATQRYAPAAGATPAAAIEVIKRNKLERVLNDYGFGGYMIASGLAPFIDGRTELYGARMMLQHDRALSSNDPTELLALLERYAIDATLLTPATPAVSMLDRTDGWRRLFADDVAVVHVRKPQASPAPTRSAPARQK